MRIVGVIFLLAVLLSACDENRVYEKNRDFKERSWLVSDTTVFEFRIADTVLNYNMYCNIRNSLAFPYSRLFVNAYLEDSTGRVMQKKLIQTYLFDRDTGKPMGSSGLGDIYDQRIPLMNAYRFPYSGKYKMRFEQYMRKDTLEGMLAIGLRVEKTSP
jgi:gliding motility-associated lipoprotein GldH